MLASALAILLAFNSHFCDSIITLVNKASFKTETHRLNPLKTLKSTNHMKTNTTSSNTASNKEITLGWNSMPAYGEVMTQVIGTSHTDVKSSISLGSKSVLKTFWSTLSNLK
jgi:hypothetical protein